MWCWSNPDPEAAEGKKLFRRPSWGSSRQQSSPKRRHSEPERRRVSPGLPSPPGSSSRAGGAAGIPAGSRSPRVPLTSFRFNDLKEATENFSSDLVLGDGGFGTVYMGWIPEPSGDSDSLRVAIKRLNADSYQGTREWLAEIFVLGKLRHPNLVRLIGYCSEGSEGLLVYEYMSNGSLDYHLFIDRKKGSKSSQPVLRWDIRLKVALDAAKGLAYLHDNNIIHRDLKAPNILLDDDMNAKLSDFGLAKETKPGQTHISTRILGTMGYLDPRYARTGQLTKKSDVYSYGVMLLELLTGKPARYRGFELVDWAKECEPMNVLSLLDPSLPDYVRTGAAKQAARKLAAFAKFCIDDDPTLRPAMSELVPTLQRLWAAEEKRMLREAAGL